MLCSLYWCLAHLLFYSLSPLQLNRNTPNNFFLISFPPGFVLHQFRVWGTFTISVTDLPRCSTSALYHQFTITHHHHIPPLHCASIIKNHLETTAHPSILPSLLPPRLSKSRFHFKSEWSLRIGS